MRFRLAFGLFIAFAAAGCAAAQPEYQVLGTIAGPDGGWDYAHVDATHDRLLVAHGTAVMAVNLQSLAVTPAFATGGRLHDVLPVEGDRQLVVTDAGTGTARFLDAATGALLAEVKAGRAPDAVAVDEGAHLVLVMDHAGGDVILIDEHSHAALASIPIGGALEAAAVDGLGYAYVNVEDRNEIAVLDLAARKVKARYALKGCDGPTGIAYDAYHNLLIAACDGATALVDAASGKTVATLPTGARADGVAFDPTRHLAFVPSGADGRLSIIDVRRDGAQVVQTVRTEPGARTLALDIRTGRIYLPAAQRGQAPAGGGSGPLKPGTFHVLMVGP